ncbi:MAG TPA: hypothetical protein VFP72_19165 [Kineosporiaceae bacterium]|nr:hypothetical protein [Kineosporiaceae bacterium]
MTRRPAREDRGASLLIALVFVTVTGLVVASLLGYVTSSVRSVKATDARVASSYDADGALQTALQDLNSSGYNNAAGDTACASPRVYEAKNTDQSGNTKIQVVCSPASGTGAQSPRPKNLPENALLTLSRATWEDGLSKGKNNVLKVTGPIASNSTITQASGTLCDATPQPPGSKTNCQEIYVDQGAVTAIGACDPLPSSGKGTAIYSTESVRCGTHATPAAAPGYVLPTASTAWTTAEKAFALQPVPQCPAKASTKTVEFTPGYYNDAKKLNDLFKNCSPRAFLFPHGFYYFDFKNGEIPGLAAAAHVWDISSPVTVVAGTAQGWDPNATTTSAPPAVPGACVSPLNSQSNGGSVFVFGGDSRLNLTAGSLEICAQYDATQPPLAVYGAPTPPAGASGLRGELTSLPGGGNCVGLGTGAGSCPLITAKPHSQQGNGGNQNGGSQETGVFLQGMLYAPVAAQDITLNNVGAAVFSWGAVVRSLSIDITPSDTYSGSFISIPVNLFTPAPLRLYLTAYACPSGQSCTGQAPATPWVPVGRAIATISPARKVSVTAWQVSPL